MAAGFKAKYTSDCPACDDQIDMGNMVTVVETPRGRVVVHLGCEGFDVVPDHTAPPDYTNPTVLMPRGKTAKDRCDDCFMVHSSGQQGCE